MFKTLQNKIYKINHLQNNFFFHFQASTGGRVTVFQTCLPSAGPGKLGRRELSNMSGNAKVSIDLIYLCKYLFFFIS